MEFELEKSIEILQRTPQVLNNLLLGISNEWLLNNEGKNTFSPYEVVGHIIHNELTDWLPRIKIILSNRVEKTFEPFDRFAHLKKDQNIPIDDLLKEFENLRIQSLAELQNFKLKEPMFLKTGVHPDLGEVNLRQLLSAWIVHDLGHIGQIARVMAKQYKNEVGPWAAYLGVLHR